MYNRLNASDMINSSVHEKERGSRHLQAPNELMELKSSLTLDLIVEPIVHTLHSFSKRGQNLLHVLRFILITRCIRQIPERVDRIDSLASALDR